MVAKNTKVGFLAFAGMIALMSPCSAALTTPPITEDEKKCKEMVREWRAGAEMSYTNAILSYFGITSSGNSNS